MACHRCLDYLECCCQDERSDAVIAEAEERAYRRGFDDGQGDVAVCGDVDEDMRAEQAAATPTGHATVIRSEDVAELERPVTPWRPGGTGWGRR